MVMDNSRAFSDYKEKDGNVVQPFMYEPLANELSSDDSSSNTIVEMEVIRMTRTALGSVTDR